MLEIKTPANTGPPPASSALKPEIFTPLQVRLIHEEERKTYLDRFFPFLAGFVALAVIAMIILWAAFIFPHANTAPVALGSGLPKILVGLSYPIHIAFGDESYMDVTVINEDSQEITGTAVISFTGSVPVRLASGESTVIDLAGLKAGARRTQRIHFAINAPPRWCSGETLLFSIQVLDRQGSLPEEQRIAVTPILYLNTFLSVLQGSAVVGGLIGLLWDTIKRRLLPPQEK